jgi:prepilin-type N-terminal cleavage/methylation domain-containing protein
MYYFLRNSKKISIKSILTSSPGFTLIELLLVVAMFGIIVMFSISLSSNFLWRTDLDSALSTSIASLRYAQVLAQTENNGVDHGVHFEDNHLILFQGNNFINRNNQKDQEYGLGSVFVSNPVDVIYHKFSGYTYENQSEINLTTNENNVNLIINKEGVINY